MLGLSASDINSRRRFPLRSFLLASLKTWTILFTFCVDVFIPLKGPVSSVSSCASNDRLCGCMLGMLSAGVGGDSAEVLVTVKTGKL